MYFLELTTVDVVIVGVGDGDDDGDDDPGSLGFPLTTAPSFSGSLNRIKSIRADFFQFVEFQTFKKIRCVDSSFSYKNVQG